MYGKIRRVPESPVAFTCVKLWEESVHSEWIRWEESLSASEKRLKQVTAVRWLGVRASRRTMHSGTAYPSLHGTVKPLFEHVWKSIRTEIQHNTISFLLHSLHRQCLNRIMSDNNEGALLKMKNVSFIQTMQEREEYGAGPSLETKLSFKRNSELVHLILSIKSPRYMSDY